MTGFRNESHKGKTHWYLALCKLKAWEIRWQPTNSPLCFTISICQPQSFDLIVLWAQIWFEQELSNFQYRLVEWKVNPANHRSALALILRCCLPWRFFVSMLYGVLQAHFSATSAAHKLITRALESYGKTKSFLCSHKSCEPRNTSNAGVHNLVESSGFYCKMLQHWKCRKVVILANPVSLSFIHTK